MHKANDAKVYHYRDSSGLEVDAIVQKRNGDYAAFEIKLGIGQIDEAAANLKKFVAVLDTDKTQPPKSLNIITRNRYEPYAHRWNKCDFFGKPG